MVRVSPLCHPSPSAPGIVPGPAHGALPGFPYRHKPCRTHTAYSPCGTFGGCSLRVTMPAGKIPPVQHSFLVSLAGTC